MAAIGATPALAPLAINDRRGDGCRSLTLGEAVEFACVVETAIRSIAAREAEYRENFSWRRERSPAAPPPKEA